MRLIFEAPRPWKELREKEKIVYLLRNKLAGKHFYIRNTSPPAQVNINRFNEDLSVHCYIPVDLTIGQKITVYTTMNRHVEIDFDVLSFPGEGQILVSPLAVRIGQSFRVSSRLPVKPEIVYAKNFQVLKDETQSDKNRIAFDIVFREFENKLRVNYPNISITGAGSDKKNRDVQYCEKKGIPVLVKDALSPQGYEAPEDKFAPYGKELELSGQLDKVIHQSRTEKIRSILCVPVNDSAAGQGRLIAVVRITDPEPDRFTEETLEEVRSATAGIPGRIHSLNCITIDRKQDVIDLSENGVAFCLEDEVLLKNLPGKKNLTFDLIFRNQPPVRLQGSVKHIHENDNKLIVGVQFAGEGHSATGRGAMERFLMYLKNLRRISAGPEGNEVSSAAQQSKEKK